MTCFQLLSIYLYFQSQLLPFFCRREIISYACFAHGTHNLLRREYPWRDEYNKQGSITLFLVQNTQCFVGHLPEISSLHLDPLEH